MGICHDANPSSGFEATSKPIVKIKDATPATNRFGAINAIGLWRNVKNLVSTPAAPAIHDPKRTRRISHTLPPSSIEPAARTITPP